jgi:parallel beta-helix repeat protein
MKATSLLIVLLLFCFSVHAATYYISASDGDDSRTVLQAQSPATPWRSLDKVNSFFPNLQPGDSVLFKRGDTFYGVLTISRSGTAADPIVLSAYGTGGKPVISGLTTLSSWVSKGGGIYESATALPNTALNMVVINGKLQAMGRYPNADVSNKGYLTFEGSSDGTSLTDNELPSTPNWTGAEVVVRSNHWTLNKATIGSHVGTTLTFKTPMERSAPNYGYFIQDDIRTLDQVGEWYYNPLTRKLSVFFGTLSPSLYRVEAGTLEDLLYLNRQSYITVEGLSFRGSNDNTFEIISATGFSLQNCEVAYAGRNALMVYGSPTALRVANNTFVHTHNNAIDVTGYTLNALIKGNTIRNTGLFEGMCESGNKSSMAINAKGDGYTIENNTIDSTGQTVIRFVGDNILVKNNLITNFNLIKDDGGAIAVNNPSGSEGVNRRIIGNIILNGLGALNGTDRAWVASSGIYLDDRVYGVEVTGNTIANCVKTGIYVHNTSAVTLRNNTLFDNRVQLTLTHDQLAADNPIRELNVKNNIFFSRRRTQRVLQVKTIKDDINLMGAIDSNYYCRPLDENMINSVTYVNSSGAGVGNAYELKGWQDAFVYDKNSQRTARQLASYTINSLLSTNKFANGSFTNDISGLSTSPSGIGTWVSAKLDGGTFQATMSATAGQSEVKIPVGAVSAAKNYVLRFSVQSTKDTLLNVLLYGGSGTRLTEIKVIKVGPTTREYEFLFPNPLSDASARVSFITKAVNCKLWLDDVEFYEADVTLLDPDNRIRFEYNASNTAKTIPLDAAYVDVKNKPFSGAITLQPYTSIILLKDSNIENLQQAVNQLPTVNLTAPLANASFTAPASVVITASAADADGTIAKVEFFNGSTLVGTATTAPYTVTWSGVPAGTYSLTAKATDNTGQTSVSAAVTISVKAPLYTFYKDADGDSFGDENVQVVDSILPSGYVRKGGDCNDLESSINPGMQEICGNGIDDNCNGQTDENCSVQNNPTIILSSIDINDTIVNQATGIATLTIRMSKASNVSVLVHFKTFDGTARGNINYVPVEGDLEIPAGALYGKVSVNILNGPVGKRYLSSNYFYLTLSNPANCLISDGTGKVTISYKKQASKTTACIL